MTRRALSAAVALGLLLPAVVQAAELTARGLLVPSREAVLSAEIAGRIAAMPVRAGNRFQKGAVLVEFDCRLYQARLGEVQGRLAAVQSRLASNEQMRKLNSIGDLDLAVSRAEAQEARSTVEGAAVMVDRCRMTAPWAGRVVREHAKPHESVEAGRQLIEIVDDTALELEVIVPSSWLGWLKAGQALTVTVDETGTSHPAKLTRLGARVDPVSQSVTVHAALSDQAPALVAGMSGAASFSKP